MWRVSEIGITPLLLSVRIAPYPVFRDGALSTLKNKQKTMRILLLRGSAESRKNHREKGVLGRFRKSKVCRGLGVWEYCSLESGRRYGNTSWDTSICTYSAGERLRVDFPRNRRRAQARRCVRRLDEKWLLHKSLSIWTSTSGSISTFWQSKRSLFGI